MRKFWQSTKVKLLAVGVVVAVLVSLISPISVSFEKPKSLLTVGSGQKVLRIGNIASAAGDIDYGTDGTNDNEQFVTAIAVLNGVGGGEIIALSANYSWANATTVNVPANVTIRGTGRASYFAGDGATAIFTATGNNTAFQDIRTDDGGIDMGATTGWIWLNVKVGTAMVTKRTEGYYALQADGDSDDDAEIQAALTAGAGGQIILSTGNFNLTADLSIPALTILEGQGDGTVLTYSGNSIVNAITFSGNSSSVGRLKVVIASGTGQAGARPNIVYGNNIAGSTVYSLTMLNDVSVGDDGVSERQNNVYFLSSNNITVQNSYFGATKRHALYYKTTVYSKVLNNTFENGVYQALTFGVNSYYNTAIGNIINNTGCAVFLYSGANFNTITGNTMAHNQSITGYNLAGIELYASSYNTITGNVIDNNDAAGIGFVNNSLSNTVSGNVITQNDNYGIDIASGSTNNEIIGNVIVGNSGGQIRNSATGTIIHSNTGYVTENSGASVGTGAQQTIAHGLNYTPTKTDIGIFSDNSTGTAYQSANPDATNIYVTEISGSAWHWGTIRR